ncbi:MAG: plastocyanin/azurin family copper-binding protein [Actinomycetota bacterium]
MVAALVLPLLVGAAGGQEALGAATSPVTVGITDFAFGPDQLVVRAGESVLWVNQSPGTRHAVTAENGTFDSNTVKTEGLDGGLSFSHVFTEPGTYAYYCPIHTPAHPTMRGTVVVEAAAAGPAPAGPAARAAQPQEQGRSGGGLGVPIPVAALVFVVLVAAAFYAGYRKGPKQKRPKAAK